MLCQWNNKKKNILFNFFFLFKCDLQLNRVKSLLLFIAYFVRTQIGTRFINLKLWNTTNIII